MNPKQVLKFAKDQGAVCVDLRFCDFFGSWQHFTVPMSEMNEGVFKDGFGFDGSSIRGWKTIDASDMLVIPSPATAVMDPFFEHPTLVMMGNIIDPVTKEEYSRCPRTIAHKAEAYLKSTKLGDTAYFGPEPEFFVFDDVRYDNNAHSAYYLLDSVEAIWNSGRDEEPNTSHKIRHKEGYIPCPPSDAMQDLRQEMVSVMEQVGIIVERQHHEVATAGQAEIDMRFNSLVKMGDQLSWYKYIIKQVAQRHGLSATFMPKPIFGDNGSGMHCHQSIWKGNKPLFAGKGYAGMSDMAMHYIAGILKHARSIAAFSNPTSNSYRRLVPGFEAPVNLAYSSRNRSASVRIPMYSQSPKAKRIEVRFPDPSANGYLAFSAMLMAGLDGIKNKLDPGDPLDKNIYSLTPEELSNVPSMPGSLEEALEALQEDHEFLLQGDVFTEDVIETWIDYKMENEIGELRLRPHPYEFYLHYDC